MPFEFRALCWCFSEEHLMLMAVLGVAGFPHTIVWQVGFCTYPSPMPPHIVCCSKRKCFGDVLPKLSLAGGSGERARRTAESGWGPSPCWGPVRQQRWMAAHSQLIGWHACKKTSSGMCHLWHNVVVRSGTDSS